MRLRGKITIRNDEIITARQALGLNQVQLAECAEISTAAVQSLERLDYSRKSAMDEALAIASFLELDVQSVLPDELLGKCCSLDKESVAEMTPAQLMDQLNREMALSMDKRLTLAAPDDIISDKELNDRFTKVIKSLPPREGEVISMRYGLDGGYRHTLGEVARALKITRERARQIEAKAIRKLQHPIRLGKLKGMGDVEALMREDLVKSEAEYSRMTNKTNLKAELLWANIQHLRTALGEKCG